MRLHRLVLSLVLTAFATVVTAVRATAQGTPPSARDTSRTPNLRPTPDGEQMLLTLRDGSRLLGRITAVTSDSITVVSSVGTATLARAAVAGVERVRSTTIHDGELWPENPSRTRLFFAPTGRMLRQGELYFSDVYIVFPSLQGGITDRFSIGGGVSVVPGVALDQQLLYATPKVGLYASANVNVAAGVLVATAKDLTDESPLGMAYGVSTFGPEDASVSVGAGFGFSRHSRSNALLMVGGERRVARSLSLVTENYLYAGRTNDSVLSGGLRAMSEHIAVDLAVAGSPGSGGVVPYLSFVYRW